jgi:predicted phosphohydrolase
MTIQYCSDLHLEFSQNRKFITKYPLKPTGDILLLAGDIVPFSEMEEHTDFFDYIADNFETAYWVPGNHEYYHADILNRSGAIKEAIRSNVFLVNNCAVQLDKIQLIFSTLWSALSPANYLTIQNRMADFSAIHRNGERFTPDNYNQLHQECKRFIAAALQVKTTVPVIVVTHHIPTFLQYPAKYTRDILNEAFAVELYDLIEANNINYWLYGHHHVNTPDFTIGKTQLLTNQLGYIKYKENIGFRNEAVIKIS